MVRVLNPELIENVKTRLMDALHLLIGYHLQQLGLFSHGFPFLMGKQRYSPGIAALIRFRYRW